jgi:chemotaxis protein CheC
MERDSMAEIGNIILNAIISSMSTTLGLSFDGSLPEVNVIEADGIFSEAMGRSEVGGNPSTVLALTIDFELATRQVNGYLAFLLDIPSTERLRSRIAQYIDGA